MVEYLPEKPKLTESSLDQYLKALSDDQVPYTLCIYIYIYYIVYIVVCMHVVSIKDYNLFCLSLYDIGTLSP